MISPNKRAANRANARASTGPRTPNGKARAAGNATRHGLGMSCSTHAAYALEINDWTLAVVGRDTTPRLRRLASAVAAAQIDYLRVREAQVSLLQQVFHALGAARREASQKGRQRVSSAQKQSTELPELPKDWSEKLRIFDRYEQRAFSRRKTAMRAYDMARRQIAEGAEDVDS